MGLDAVVNCSCFAAGMTLPPPVPVMPDEDGLPTLDPHAIDDAGAFERYIEWRETCCPHPFQEYARERIGTWGEVEDLRAAIARAGAGHFPVLARCLAGEDPGRTAAGAAAVALRELGAFRGLGRLGRGTFLVDTRTGEVLHRRARPGNDGVFLSATPVQVLLDGDDLVIVDADFHVELFRARRLRQVLLGPDPGDGRLRREQAEFTDLDTGATHVAACAIGKPVVPAGPAEEGEPITPDWEYPELVHVERRPIRPADFAEILDALERIFRAAVETGRPVHWC